MVPVKGKRPRNKELHISEEVFKKDSDRREMFNFR